MCHIVEIIQNAVKFIWENENGIEYCGYVAQCNKYVVHFLASIWKYKRYVSHCKICIEHCVR